jgi:hypothetical protein
LLAWPYKINARTHFSALSKVAVKSLHRGRVLLSLVCPFVPRRFPMGLHPASTNAIAHQAGQDNMSSGTWYGILKRGNAHVAASKRVGYFSDTEIVVVESLGSWIGNRK